MVTNSRNDDFAQDARVEACLCRAVLTPEFGRMKHRDSFRTTMCPALICGRHVVTMIGHDAAQALNEERRAIKCPNPYISMFRVLSRIRCRFDLERCPLPRGIMGSFPNGRRNTFDDERLRALALDSHPRAALVSIEDVELNKGGIS